jgi:hypothetical protein
LGSLITHLFSGKELIELTQVWQRHLHRRDNSLSAGQVHSGRDIRAFRSAVAMLDDRLDVVAAAAVVHDDSAFDA